MQRADPRIIVWWRDFHYPSRWQYPDLAPSQIIKLRQVSSDQITRPELIRATWLWSRRPRLILGTGALSYVIMVVCTVIVLVIPVFGFFLAAGWLAIWILAIAIDTIRYVRWRRDYEIALDRLLRFPDLA